MYTFDAEQIVLGISVTYHQRDVAADLVASFLPDTNFVYNADGTLHGREHASIWSAIIQARTEGLKPTPAVVSSYLDDTELSKYVYELPHILSDRHLIMEYDPKLFQHQAKTVYAFGRVVSYITKSRALGSFANNQESLEKYFSVEVPIDRIDEWANDYIRHLRGNVATNTTEGYRSTYEGAQELYSDLDAFESGKQIFVLDSGLPTLTSRGMMERGKLAVVHGMSNTGKSAFTHAVNLGTAINLLRNNLPGCVAINSLEMKHKDVLKRYAAMLSGFNTRKLLGKFEETGEAYERFKVWLDFVSRLPIYTDQTNMLTTSVMEYRSQGLHTSNAGPIRQMSSDFLEMFADDPQDYGGDIKFYTYIARKHQWLAQEMNASMMLISQSTYTDNSKTWIAGPFGTRGSRGIFHATDYLIEIYNPPAMRSIGINPQVPEGMYSEGMNIIVQKGRDGGVGHFPFGWNAESTQIRDQKLLQIGGGELFEGLYDVFYDVMGHTAPQLDTSEPAVIVFKGEDF